MKRSPEEHFADELEMLREQRAKAPRQQFVDTLESRLLHQLTKKSMPSFLLINNICGDVLLFKANSS